MRATDQTVLPESPSLTEAIEQIVNETGIKPLSTYRIQFHNGFKLEQARELVGLHFGLRRALEAHVGRAAVRPVPDQHALPARGECLREFANAGDVLAEPTA